MPNSLELHLCMSNITTAHDFVPTIIVANRFAETAVSLKLTTSIIIDDKFC